MFDPVEVTPSSALQLDAADAAPKEAPEGRPLRAQRHEERDSATVHDLRERIRSMQRTTLDERALPTLPAVASLLPGGALRSGAVYSVLGSTSLALALLAGPSAAGQWCGAVGVPDLGIEAAAGLGIDLDRLVLVPEPGQHWLRVTAAIADAFGIVLLRPPRRGVDSADAARLAARLRERECTLIVQGPWPQAEASVNLLGSDWRGIGTGHGVLGERSLRVSVESRSAAVRRREVRLA